MNNKSIALNSLKQNDKKIRHLFKSEFNKIRKKQTILLIITDGQKEHYVCVKNVNSLSKLLNHCS